MTARLYEIIYLAFEQNRCELYFYTYHNFYNLTDVMRVTVFADDV